MNTQNGTHFDKSFHSVPDEKSNMTIHAIIASSITLLHILTYVKSHQNELSFEGGDVDCKRQSISPASVGSLTDML